MFFVLNGKTIRLVDSFQNTLDYDRKKDDQSKPQENIQDRILNNLKKLTNDYCCDKNPCEENDTEEHVYKSFTLSNDNRQKEDLSHIENIMKKYNMLLESLEFRMERHEQLTKLVQKSMKLTLIEQETRKVNMKK